MKRSLVALLVWMAASCCQAQLMVSPDHHYLLKKDGKPFFWLGDTAWELFHRLNREEARQYLDNRAAKGFTVIQAVVLAEFDGLNTPNAYGQLPLLNNDPTTPNEAYFKHVDFIVNEANKRGLIIAMLLLSLIFIRPLRSIRWEYVLFCLSFVLIQFLIIGETTPVLGAVTRYKTIALPFLLIAFLFVLSKEKLLKGLPFLKKILSQ